MKKTVPTLFPKRQKIGALQKLSRHRSRSEIREASWSAAVSCRFFTGVVALAMRRLQTTMRINA